jgi:hypothetical protein
MSKPSELPDDILSLINSIKVCFDDDRCLHARDDLVKCRALAAASGCSEAFEEFVQEDSQMRVIIAHICMLNEALELVRNDSSGWCPRLRALVIASAFNIQGYVLPWCSLTVFQDGHFFTTIMQALETSKYPPSKPSSFQPRAFSRHPQIWHRAEGDSPVHGFKVSATIRAPAQALLALISEIDLYSSLFPFLSKSLEVQRLGRARRVANVVLKGRPFRSLPIPHSLQLHPPTPHPLRMFLLSSSSSCFLLDTQRPGPWPTATSSCTSTFARCDSGWHIPHPFLFVPLSSSLSIPFTALDHRRASSAALVTRVLHVRVCV